MGVNILRDKKVILPCISFCKHEVDLCGVERGDESAVFSSAEELCLRVIKVLIVLSSAIELVSDFIFTHFLCHAGNTPVIVSIFESLRHRFTFNVGCYITISLIIVEAEDILISSIYHCSESLFSIEARESVDICVGNDRYRVVAYHAEGLICSEFPCREYSACLIIIQEGVDDIHFTLRCEESEQRVLGAEGVPEREHGIARSVGLMNLKVMSAIAAVGIRIDVRHAK